MTDKPLLLWALVVLIVWTVYHNLSNLTTNTFDGLLAAYIAIGCAYCVAVQTIFTVRWRVLSLGVLSFFFAMHLIYTRTAAYLFDIDLWQEPVFLSLIRSLVFVGVTLMIVGLSRWGWKNRHHSFPWWRQADGRDPFGLHEHDE